MSQRPFGFNILDPLSPRSGYPQSPVMQKSIITPDGGDSFSTRLENTAHQVFVEQPALMPVQVQPMLVQHLPVCLEQVPWETGVPHPVGPIQWELFQHEQPATPRTPRQSFVEVQFEVPVEVKKIVEVEKVYFKKVKKYIDVPVEVEVIKEVPQPYERVVYVEVPVETIVWRDVPASIEPTEGRVISKEVRVPVEVIREVLVPVEKVVEKEIQVPVEVRTYAESRRGEAIVRGTEIVRSSQQTSEHVRVSLSSRRDDILSVDVATADLKPKSDGTATKPTVLYASDRSPGSN